MDELLEQGLVDDTLILEFFDETLTMFGDPGDYHRYALLLSDGPEKQRALKKIMDRWGQADSNAAGPAIGVPRPQPAIDRP